MFWAFWDIPNFLTYPIYPYLLETPGYPDHSHGFLSHICHIRKSRLLAWRPSRIQSRNKPGPTWGIHGYPGDSTIKNSHFGIPQGSPGWFFKGDPTNWVQDPGDSAPNHPGSSHEIQPALLVIYGHIWQYLYIILIILQKIL